MSSTAATLDLRQFFVLTPEIVLAVWGLVVLMVDVGLLRKRTSAQRRQATGRLALVGTLAAFATACRSLIVRYDLFGYGSALNFSGIDFSDNPDPVLFFGTVSHDVLTETFDLLYILLLALVVWMSTAWSFTEDWGEYFALIFWSTVGMMLLTASEELLTLFLTLETMTICLYLCTAFEKTRRRSAEGGLKYFVYGSVSSALFLFGLSMVYGLTGSTQFDAIRQVVVGTRATTGTAREYRGDDGGPPDAGRLRVQGRGRPVPPVGARRLRGGAGPGHRLDRDRVEDGQLRRPDEGLAPRAEAVGEPNGRDRQPRLDRRRDRPLGRLDDLRQLRRAGPAQPQANAGLLVDRARRLHAGGRGGGGGLREPRGGGRLGPVLPGHLRLLESGGLRGRGLAGPRSRERRHRRPRWPRTAVSLAGDLHPPADALADRHAPPGRFLRKTLYVHGSAERAGPGAADAALAGRPGTAQQRRLGVLLRAGPQGDVPPEPGPGGHVAPLVIDRGADRAGHGGGDRLRDRPRAARGDDEERGGPDALVERPAGPFGNANPGQASHADVRAAVLSWNPRAMARPGTESPDSRTPEPSPPAPTPVATPKTR